MRWKVGTNTEPPSHTRIKHGLVTGRGSGSVYTAQQVSELSFCLYSFHDFLQVAKGLGNHRELSLTHKSSSRLRLRGCT